MKLNSDIILKLISSKARSRADLCKILSLSKAAISNAVSTLVDMGVVLEGERFNDNPLGRKTAVLKVANDFAYFLGTDIDGQKINAVLLDSQKNIISSTTRAISPVWSIESVSEQWVEILENLISSNNISIDQIAALGVGLPGTVNSVNLTTRAYLPPGRWIDFDVKAVFESMKIPFNIANNVVCVSEYERSEGVVKDVEDFVSILIRYGIGSCICNSGVFINSQSVVTGELGHTKVRESGTECVCGSKGCLDVLASGRTWAMCNFKDNNDYKAELQNRAKYLAVGIGNLLKLYHSPILVLNGIYNHHREFFSPAFAESLEQELSGLKLPVPEIHFSENAGLKTSLGAANIAIETVSGNYITNTLNQKMEKI